MLCSSCRLQRRDHDTGRAPLLAGGSSHRCSRMLRTRVSLACSQPAGCVYWGPACCRVLLNVTCMHRPVQFRAKGFCHMQIACFCQVGSVITQNVDRLHHAAGTRDVLELHGTTHRWHLLNAADAAQYLLRRMQSAIWRKRSRLHHSAKPSVCFFQGHLHELWGHHRAAALSGPAGRAQPAHDGVCGRFTGGRRTLRPAGPRHARNGVLPQAVPCRCSLGSAEAA
jgi:Sir2 family